MHIIFDFLLQNGVNIADVQQLQRLYLILLLIPIVATIIGFARYVIGIRSINFYTPLFATFILFEIANTTGSSNFLSGLKYGLLFFVIVFLTSTVFYKILKRLRMHYIPKLSIIITATSLTMMFVLSLMALFEKTLPLSISSFLFVGLIVMSEGFMSIYAKKNFKYTAILTIESLAISIISYTVISLYGVQQFVITNPWIVLVLIVVNVYIGRFLGLRWMEYWRFRTILLNQDNVDEQAKSNPKK